MSIDFGKALSSFPDIVEMMREHAPAIIIRELASYLGYDLNALINAGMGGYSKGQRSGSYYYVLHDLNLHLPDYEWLYEQLHDPVSKEVFTNLMRFRIVPAPDYIKAAYDGENPQYFDRNIVPANPQEVFVDCGGFIGDTAQSYIDAMGAYKRMYVYEPSSENFRKCEEALKNYDNIVLKQAGVGRKNEELLLGGSSSSSSFSSAGTASTNGDAIDTGERVQVISLDEDIKEPVTYIKMDIECFEIDGIMGARRHIIEETPKLAICLYHILSDMWEIPKLIYALNPGYRYYIRHYMAEQNWETVLYCIPADQAIL